MSPLALALLMAVGQAEAPPQVEISPNPTCYQPVTLTFTGPEASETGEVNPFRDYRLQLTFRLVDGAHSLSVPGHFAADGRSAETGASSGNKWRARFTPPKVGLWSWHASFRQGDNVALKNREAGKALSFDGTSGVFLAGRAEAGLAGFGGSGTLIQGYHGGLGFEGTGKWFLKAGADSPENLLAYADFDGTKALGGPQPKRDGESSRKGLHTYAPHVRDWNEGDPTWRDGKGKGLIGAINYLASQGVNSIYFLPMNVEGDGKDVWPWIDEKTRDRFDVSKLDQWEIVFTHADKLGILLHFVLTETENESLFEALDANGERGASALRVDEPNNVPFADTRKLYYRELVARFAHHPAIVWNLGEENGGGDDRFGKANTTEQRKAFANYIRDLDPYDHPIVVHTFPNQYDKIYEPLLGFDAISGLSLQMGDPKKAHAETLKWIRRSRDTMHPWFVCIDEIGPAHTGVMPNDGPNAAENHKLAREVLWGNLLAGGSGVEWYFGYKYHDNDLNCEDFRSRESVWRFTKSAIDFFHEHLPFDEMESADERVHAEGAFCFAKPGEIYAAYLPSAATPVEMDLPEGDYTIHWFDPRNGGELQSGDAESTTGGKRSVIGTPPTSPNDDWVVLVRKL